MLDEPARRWRAVRCRPPTCWHLPAACWQLGARTSATWRNLPVG